MSGVNYETLYPHLDLVTSRNWIYPRSKDFDVRTYQLQISESAIFRNTLVCLPTGLGKTLIAAVVMYNYHKWYPDGQIVFLAPTKPLVGQQMKAIHSVIGINEGYMAHLEGTVSQNERIELWQSKRFFFCTPQTMENDLNKGIINCQRLVCLVIDEAHRATGNYAYVNIVRSIWNISQHFRLLALSATPANDFNKIQALVHHLKISRIEIRTESDPDIVPYTFEKQFEYLKCPSMKGKDSMQDLIDQVNDCIQPIVNRLCDSHILDSKVVKNINGMVINEAIKSLGLYNDSSTNSNSIISEYKDNLNSINYLLDCRKLLSTLSTSINSSKYSSKTSLTSKAQSKSVLMTAKQVFDFLTASTVKQSKFYSAELERYIDTSHHIKALKSSLLRVQKDDKFMDGKKSKLVFLCQVVSEHFARRNRLSQSNSASSDNADGVSHSLTNTRIIVFCERRKTVQLIVQELKEIDSAEGIRPHMFVGQASSKTHEQPMHDEDSEPSTGSDSEDIDLKLAESKSKSKTSNRKVTSVAVRKKINKMSKSNEFPDDLMNCQDDSNVDYHIGTETSGLKQKEQRKVLEMFSNGQINVLVATSIAEEGLDIADVDLIVLFDMIKSPGRLVQRFGRCGRKRQGKVVVLLNEGGNDETKLIEANRSLKGIQTCLKDSNFMRRLQLYEPSDVNRMLSAQVSAPVLSFHDFEVKPFDGNLIRGSKWHHSDDNITQSASLSDRIGADRKFTIQESFSRQQQSAGISHVPQNIKGFSDWNVDSLSVIKVNDATLNQESQDNAKIKLLAAHDNIQERKNVSHEDELYGFTMSSAVSLRGLYLSDDVRDGRGNSKTNLTKQLRLSHANSDNNILLSESRKDEELTTEIAEKFKYDSIIDLRSPTTGDDKYPYLDSDDYPYAVNSMYHAEDVSHEPVTLTKEISSSSDLLTSQHSPVSIIKMNEACRDKYLHEQQGRYQEFVKTVCPVFSGYLDLVDMLQQSSRQFWKEPLELLQQQQALKPMQFTGVTSDDLTDRQYKDCVKSVNYYVKKGPRIGTYRPLNSDNDVMSGVECVNFDDFVEETMDCCHELSTLKPGSALDNMFAVSSLDSSFNKLSTMTNPLISSNDDNLLSKNSNDESVLIKVSQSYDYQSLDSRNEISDNSSKIDSETESFRRVDMENQKYNRLSDLTSISLTDATMNDIVIATGIMTDLNHADKLVTKKAADEQGLGNNDKSMNSTDLCYEAVVNNEILMNSPEFNVDNNLVSIDDDIQSLGECFSVDRAVGVQDNRDFNCSEVKSSCCDRFTETDASQHNGAINGPTRTSVTSTALSVCAEDLKVARSPSLFCVRNIRSKEITNFSLVDSDDDSESNSDVSSDFNEEDNVHGSSADNALQHKYPVTNETIAAAITPFTRNGGIVSAIEPRAVFQAIDSIKSSNFPCVYSTETDLSHKDFHQCSNGKYDSVNKGVNGVNGVASSQQSTRHASDLITSALQGGLKENEDTNLSDELNQNSDDDICCCVCLQGDSTDENPILICEGGCRQCVHLTCYFGTDVPQLDETFLCDGCFYNANRPSYVIHASRCVLCSKASGLMRFNYVPSEMHPSNHVLRGNTMEINDQSRTGSGPLSRQLSHICCVLFTSELTLDTRSMQPNNLSSLDYYRNSLICEICHGRGGAVVQCSYHKCFERAVHPYCVIQSSDMEIIQKASNKSKFWVCAIVRDKSMARHEELKQVQHSDGSNNDDSECYQYEMFCSDHSHAIAEKDVLAMVSTGCIPHHHTAVPAKVFLSSSSSLFAPSTVKNDPENTIIRSGSQGKDCKTITIVDSPVVVNVQPEDAQTRRLTTSSFTWEDSPAARSSMTHNRLRKTGNNSCKIKSAAKETKHLRSRHLKQQRKQVVSRYFDSEAEVSSAEESDDDSSRKGSDDEDNSDEVLSGDFINDGDYTQDLETSPGLGLYLSVDRQLAEENSPSFDLSNYQRSRHHSPDTPAVMRMLPRFRGAEKTGLPIIAGLLRKERQLERKRRRKADADAEQERAKSARSENPSHFNSSHGIAMTKTRDVDEDLDVRKIKKSSHVVDISKNKPPIHQSKSPFIQANSDSSNDSNDDTYCEDTHTAELNPVLSTINQSSDYAHSMSSSSTIVHRNRASNKINMVIEPRLPISNQSAKRPFIQIDVESVSEKSSDDDLVVVSEQKVNNDCKGSSVITRNKIQSANAVKKTSFIQIRNDSSDEDDEYQCDNRNISAASLHGSRIQTKRVSDSGDEALQISLRNSQSAVIHAVASSRAPIYYTSGMSSDANTKLSDDPKSRSQQFRAKPKKKEPIR